MDFNDIIANLPKPYYRDGQADIVIYCADCRLLLPLLPDKSIDLVLTDPPYGMTEMSGRRLHAYRNPEKSKGRIGWSNMAEVTDYGDTEWNHQPLDNQAWELIATKSKEQIVWGWNHLQTVLGKPASILVWDKKLKNDWVDTFSDCEFAYCSKIMPDRMYRQLWMGALRGGRRIERTHPTEKPVELMRWCLSLFPDSFWVIDCYMGSGSAIVASKELNRKCIGIEIEEKYCSIAAKRLSQSVMRLEV